MDSDHPLNCPRCHLPLKEVRTSYGVFWKCGNCDGRAITVELLRHTFTEESINPLWLHAIRGEGESSAPCPMCKRPMLQVALSDNGGVRVDVCKLCHFIWFDAHEVESLVSKPLEEISRERHERLASEKMKRFAEQIDQYQLARTPASALWRTLAEFFRIW